MFKQFEIILTALCLVLSAGLLVLITVRIRNVVLKKKARFLLWRKDISLGNKAGKLLMALSLLLLAPGFVYYVFIVTLPTAVVRDYAKTLFCLLFIAWALLEVVLCFSISEKLLEGSLLRRFLFYFAVILSIIGAAYFFPFIPKSLPYPEESECVILNPPVRGTWLAGQAGATTITNGHSTNRFALDILKLGQDGRMHKGNEEEVTDFYSYGEPVFAPAGGRVIQVVDGIESDVMGSRDRDHPGGNLIILDIGGGMHVYFAHLKKGSIMVEEGQSVEKGTLLARIGNSGNSTHPHLHMHIQNNPTAEQEGRVTYPFRFHKLKRKRLIFWRTVSGAALIRNDRFRN